MLTRIQLTTDDDGLAPANEPASDDNDDEWVSINYLIQLLLPAARDIT